MGSQTSLSEDLTDASWLEAVADIGEQEGYFSELGADHAALFVERRPDVLFVCFETIAAARNQSERGLPLAFDVCESREWSHLTLIAKSETWFRDREVIEFFDRMVDDAFFEEFDQVVFYGAGPSGYAACAFSVTAPGATVLAVAPQATLARPETEWDDRFPAMRRADFRTRYGYAPDMLDAARLAVVVYDPAETLDAMHAALFEGPNILRFRYRRGDATAIDADLRATGLVSKLAEGAVRGRLDAASLGRAFALRKTHVPYLRALLARTMDEDRPMLIAMVCRAVLKKHELPRFRAQLDRAMARLQEADRARPHSGERV